MVNVKFVEDRSKQKDLLEQEDVHNTNFLKNLRRRVGLTFTLGVNFSKVFKQLHSL